jgi:hypothetical protein
MIEVVVHLVLYRNVTEEKPNRSKMVPLSCYTKRVTLPFAPAIGMTLRLKDLTKFHGNNRFYEIQSIQLFDDRELASVYVEEKFKPLEKYKDQDPRFEKFIKYLLGSGWEVCTPSRKIVKGIFKAGGCHGKAPKRTISWQVFPVSEADGRSQSHPGPEQWQDETGRN